MKKIVNKINETGTLLVEAMAMLGLIAMVTPVLYKKASERTLELQDVNASSQLRALSTAVDSYLKDNFAKITEGQTIGNTNYSNVESNPNGASVGPISITEFSDYLPYGFLNADGSPRETKLFTQDGYNVYIKSEADVDASGKIRSQVLTGFVTAVPKNANDMGQTRASRIASMVGSNGGYVQTPPGDGATRVAMGTQGIWSVPVSELNNALADNTFVISSVQPIASQGLANEDVLHRKDEPTDADQELNTMETDLFMGVGTGSTRNIRMVNQIIMQPSPNRMVGGADATNHDADDGVTPMAGVAMGDKDTALYIGNGGGAYMEGALRAANSLFEATSGGIKFFGSANVDDGSGGTVTNRNANPTFSVDSNSLVYGNPGNGNPKFEVTTAGALSFGTSAVPAAGGNPAQAARTLLFADANHVTAAEENLSMVKENNVWSTVIGKVNNAATPHSGARTSYVWDANGVPDNGTDVAASNYELTVNGSAFVKDTLLTGKTKSFNVDAAALRGGVDPEYFNDAVNDEDFYMVTKMLYNDYVHDGAFRAGGYGGSISIANDYDIIENVPKGIVLRTEGTQHEDYDDSPGINIMAGYSLLPYVDDTWGSGLNTGPDNDFFGSLEPQDHMLKLGGSQGVYISAFDNYGQLNEAPVTLQGRMMKLYKRNNEAAIDMAASEVNILSPTLDWEDWHLFDDFWYADNVYYYRGGVNREHGTNWIGYHGNDIPNRGRVLIGDSNFLIASYSLQPVVDIYPSENSNYLRSRFSGGFAVYDGSYDFRNHADDGDATHDANPRAYAPTGADAAFLVSQGKLEVKTTAATNADKEITKGERILVVDNNKNTTYIPDTNVNHGTVYIRKGGINLASNTGNRLTNAQIAGMYINSGMLNDASREKNMVGYIAADRFISHFNVSGLPSVINMSNSGDASAGMTASAAGKPVSGGKAYGYERFEVNPAYTSVMHDIKLTTRGGARLSDILPDFINKGIYVVTTTYSPATTWAPGTTGIIPDSYDQTSGVTTNTEVSAYAGFIPTPKCPNGYAKVVTLTPASWAMAQAGIPYGTKSSGGKWQNLDIYENYNPTEYLDLLNSENPDQALEEFSPLMFQKNTWLKSMIMPYCGKYQVDSDGCNTNFGGWGAVMGFIYPSKTYEDLISLYGDDKHSVGSGSNMVYWNLYPVRYKQLEGYATVYCYFDRGRKSGTSYVFNPSYVDVTYDQLSASKSGTPNYYMKGVGSGTNATNSQNYIKRLDDPKLKYFSPW